MNYKLINETRLELAEMTGSSKFCLSGCTVTEVKYFKWNCNTYGSVSSEKSVCFTIWLLEASGRL
jgi:hypothetical protein